MRCVLGECLTVRCSKDSIIYIQELLRKNQIHAHWQKSTGPWPRSQSHHAGGWTFVKLKKEWGACSFRLLVFSGRYCSSPETGEACRTKGSFWGLKDLTNWQNYILKISCFLFTCNNVWSRPPYTFQKYSLQVDAMWNLVGSIMFGTW